MNRVLAVVAIVLSTTGSVAAQTTTAGVIEGRVIDARTREPLLDVTIVATGGRDQRTARTTRDGMFRLGDLLPGEYDVTFTDAADHGVFRRGVRVGALAVTFVFQRMDRSSAGLVEDETPVSSIDPTSSGLRFVADRTYIEGVPIPGRTFDAVAGAAPGGQNDGHGVAFAGATSLDNRYFVDGIDTTGPRIGNVGTSLPNEFLREVTVTTGGYSAEYGRALGGVVNAVTRSGTNEFHGSIFGSMAPGFLQAGARKDPQAPQTIDITSQRLYDAGFGFEFGGPIIRNQLWFYIGFAPQLSRTDYTRKIQTRTDCRKLLPDHTLSACSAQNADGVPDVDPKTGLQIVDTVDSEIRTATAHSFPALAKVDLALTPQQHGFVSAIVIPSSSETPGLYGAESTGSRVSTMTSDMTARWTSTLDDSLRLEAVTSWHRASTNSGSIDPRYDDQRRYDAFGSNLGDLSASGGESVATLRGCTDGGTEDRYPLIANCPNGSGATYSFGGPGARQDAFESRRSTQLAIGDRVRALGMHDVKLGIGVDDESTETARVYSGGAYIVKFLEIANTSYTYQFANLAAPNDPDPRFDRTCRSGAASFKCQIVGGTTGVPGASVDAESIDWAAYVRDSWQLSPNVVLDAGLRYESQRLLYPNDLRGGTDPITRNRLGDNAIALRGNVAPRIGVAYDPTNEGRAKVFAHWGRFFESLPTQVIEDYFSRSVLYQTNATSPCLFNTGRMGVDPSLSAGFVDELVTGAEYEPDPAVTLAATIRHRTLGRAIEDVASGNGATYTLANPGFGMASRIDKPVRDYDAVVLSIARRFSSRLYAQASYTYARTVGNYTGTIGYDDNDYSATHTSAQFDLVELLVNRQGALPQDRPHSLKVDGVYLIPFRDHSSVVLGARFRALSGIPVNARGDNFAYAATGSFLLPRGALGRTDFDHSLDLHAAFRHRFAHGVTAEVFTDVFNVYDRQATYTVDENYVRPTTVTGETPISGGSYDELIWLKGYGSKPVDRNPAFRQTTSRYAPTYATIGARLTF